MRAPRSRAPPPHPLPPFLARTLTTTFLSDSGKSLESTLTQKAWGTDYSTVIDDKALAACNNRNPEGPSPGMVSLRNKRYIMSDEIGQFDSNTVKKLLGGGLHKGRNLNEGVQEFYLDFPVLVRAAAVPPRAPPHHPVHPPPLAAGIVQQRGPEQEAVL